MEPFAEYVTVRFEEQHRDCQRVLGYLETAYAPMVELLGYLEANGFSNHMVSGSGADFMRPITQEMFGIPRERVIGSTTALGVRRAMTRVARSLAGQSSAFSTTGR